MWSFKTHYPRLYWQIIHLMLNCFFQHQYLFSKDWASKERSCSFISLIYHHVGWRFVLQRFNEKKGFKECIRRAQQNSWSRQQVIKTLSTTINKDIPRNIKERYRFKTVLKCISWTTMTPAQSFFFSIFRYAIHNARVGFTLKKVIVLKLHVTKNRSSYYCLVLHCNEAIHKIPKVDLSR